MNMLILDASQSAQLAALNLAGDPVRQLQPVPLGDGRFALNSDLLQDCGPGQTWEHYTAFLQTLGAELIASVPGPAL